MKELFVICAASTLVAVVLSFALFIINLVGGAFGTLLGLVIFFGGTAGVIMGFSSILDSKS